MKIGIIIQELDIKGGTQRQALELAIYLKKKGHPVKIYTFSLDAGKCYGGLLKQLDVVEASQNVSNNWMWRLPGAKRLLAPYYSYRQMKRQAEKLVNIMDSDFDVVNCHDYGNVVLPATIYRRKYGAPTVWMANDLPLYDSRFRARSFKELAMAFLGDVRGNWIYKRCQKKWIAQLNAITVLDEYNKNLLPDYLASEATVIRSGLDINRFSFPEGRTPGTNGFKALTAGIFFTWRRFEDAVDVVKFLKDDGLKIQLDIIGTEERDPAYARKIRQLVADYGIAEQVRFRGNVSEEELLRAYHSADVFLFPHSPQTWGLTVFEAMACGTPVIVSTGCGASEVLTHGENALVVPPQSPVEMAKSLKELLQNNGLWQELSKNGRAFVEKNISWELYGEKMLRVFEELVEKKGG
jgi:glycosyltransferase involved in cell wall biosynthesis